MAYTSQTNEYRKASVNGSSPIGLIVLLYDGALRFIEAGKAAMATGDLPAQNEALQKAQKIILELMSALDMRKGGEIAKNLMALYSYVLGELIAANCENNAAALEPCIATLSELRAGWAEVEQQIRTSKATEEHVPLSSAA